MQLSNNEFHRFIRRFTLAAPLTKLTRTLNRLEQQSLSQPRSKTSQLYAKQASTYAAQANTYAVQNALLSQESDNLARFYEALHQRAQNMDQLEDEFRLKQTQDVQDKNGIVPKPYNPLVTLMRDWQSRTTNSKPYTNKLLPPM
jgi:hypothetical protein